MNEEQSTRTTVDATALEPTAAPAALTAGQLLRQAREASGLHLANLAMALKVPVKKIEAMEADDHASLPDAVFVRALATSICRQVKADPKPILDALPQKPGTVLLSTPEMGLNQAFPSASSSAMSGWQLKISSKSLLLTVALLLAAVVILWLPFAPKESPSDIKQISELVMPTKVASAPEVPVPAAPIPAVPVSTAVVSSSSTAIPESANLPSKVNSVTSAAPSLPAVATNAAPTPVTTVPPAAVVTPAVAVMSSMPSSSNTVAVVNAPVLRMVAKGIVWVEVKDAKGGILVQRNLQPKEVVNVAGASPFSVVVGRINEMDVVLIRGKPFNLTGLSPDNVARFEVK